MRAGRSPGCPFSNQPRPIFASNYPFPALLPTLRIVFLLLLLATGLPARTETPAEARAAYIMEVADSLVKARLARLDSSIMEHRLDETVKRRIVNYIENWPITATRLLSRSARYFPIFEEQLIDAGMPLALKYVSVQESGLRPFATSRVGAGGLWQLMPGTARERGLVVNEVLDERLDPELGCAAGLDYLRIQYERYGDWTLALAAYNCGPGNVNKALRRAGGKNRTYWEIRRFLPRETRNYLPYIIAAAYLMAFHHEHDVHPAPMDLDMQLTEAITVYRELSLHRVIQITGLKPEVVLELNAQYLRGYLPGLPGGHRLRLPQRVMPAMRTYLANHPEGRPETAADLPWTSPLLKTGEENTDRHYGQYRTAAGPQDTTLRQVAVANQLPVDQLAVWSNRGELDSLTTGEELIFFRVDHYRPYDPRSRDVPPPAPMVEMMPTTPVRIPKRRAPRTRPVLPVAPPAKKSGFGTLLKSWFE